MGKTTEDYIEEVAPFIGSSDVRLLKYLKELRSLKWVRWGGGTVEVMVAELLYLIVRSKQPKLILEAGTNWGYSTAHIALGSKDYAHAFHTIELDASNQAIAIKQVRGRELEIVNFVLGDSAKFFKTLAKNRIVDFCFIDSSHTYEHTIKEFDAIKESLNTGSLVCFHDAVEPKYGVKQFLEELPDIYEVLILPTQPNTGFGIVKVKDV